VKTRTPLSLAGMAPVVLLGMLVTACGSSSPAGANGGGGSPASAGTGSSGGSGGATTVADGLGHPVNVCSLLPATTAASVSGEPITVATEDDTPSYKLYTCNYTSADGTTGFVVNVLALDAVAGYEGDVQTYQTVGTAMTPISGLGDKAFSTSGGHVEALFGNVRIDVANLSDAAAGETLIRDLQPKL
jgi:hypothetical protein